jgi:hypothetical protein
MSGEPHALSLERCDPGGVIRAALAGPPVPGLRDLWLGWVMRLPSDVDAAEAATALLAACSESGGPDELLRLLEATAGCTVQRMSRLEPRRRGRRGSASGRD